LTYPARLALLQLVSQGLLMACHCSTADHYDRNIAVLFSMPLPRPCLVAHYNSRCLTQTQGSCTWRRSGFNFEKMGTGGPLSCQVFMNLSSGCAVSILLEVWSAIFSRSSQFVPVRLVDSCFGNYVLWLTPGPDVARFCSPTSASGCCVTVFTTHSRKALWYVAFLVLPVFGAGIDTGIQTGTGPAV
jgi:hypothetical protein